MRVWARWLTAAVSERPFDRSLFTATAAPFCKRARVEQLAGDTTSASAALAEAETMAAELQPGPDSELGQELSKARAALGASF
jgi:hypothetical protein